MSLVHVRAIVVHLDREEEGEGEQGEPHQEVVHPRHTLTHHASVYKQRYNQSVNDHAQ